MILTDVNVLVYAFRREAADHPRYATWLGAIVAGAEEVGLHEAVLAGFTRVVTNRRVFANPAPTSAALTFVDRLVAAPRARWLSGPAETWARFTLLARGDPGVSGNLVPDAHLAAVALSHGCRLATADRGFARFPGLDWFDPGSHPTGHRPVQE